MKTLTLNRAEAITLGGVIAKRWARVAIWCAAGGCRANNPFRNYSDNSAAAVAARKARYEAERRQLADMLRGLGVELPAVDEAAIIAPWRNPRTGKMDGTWFIQGAPVHREADRLVKLIAGQLG